MHFSTSTIMAAAALIPSSMAHYCFNKLIVDGNYTGEYEYVRKNTNSNSPVTDLTSNDLRCNVGGLASGNVTSTYTVAAGSKVGFGLDSTIGHPGPVQVYLSEAPSGTAASDYDGSGDWFKVYELGPAEITSAGLQWADNGIQNFTFTLPDETPAGQYLMRVEQIALHGASVVGGAQFYISCAQIEVTSDSTATPAPTVSIPGVYTGTEPGIEINIYYPIPTNYTMPGPAVWPSTGETNTTIPTAASSSSSTAAATSAATSAASSSAAASSTVATSSVATSSVATQVAAASTSSVASVSVSGVAIPSSEPKYTFPGNGTGPAFPTGSGACSTGFITVTASRPHHLPSGTGAITYSGTGGLPAGTGIPRWGRPAW